MIQQAVQPQSNEDLRCSKGSPLVRLIYMDVPSQQINYLEHQCYIGLFEGQTSKSLSAKFISRFIKTDQQSPFQKLTYVHNLSLIRHEIFPQLKLETNLYRAKCKQKASQAKVKCKFLAIKFNFQLQLRRYINTTSLL